MTLNKNIVVVIPAHNERKTIGKVIKDLKNHNYNKIIVIDDGSTDNTDLVASTKGAMVVGYLHNYGQGHALSKGIDLAFQLDKPDIIITFDADGQHQAKDVKNLIKVIKEGYDVALGSRFLKKNKIPFFKKIILKGGVLMIKLFYGADVTDAHNGLRALSAKAAKVINITENRMAHASEIMEKIMKHQLKYKEVPVTIKYTKYSKLKGQSIFNALKILWRMFVRKWKN